MIIVDLAAATLCIASTCYPALIGDSTPVGEYQITHMRTQEPGYGGDILVFKISDDQVFAIHRILDVEGQQRLSRIRSPYARHRTSVTNGCINVEPEVYDAIVECCSNSIVQVK